MENNLEAPDRRKQRSTSRAGFSLIEIMIAFSIAAVGLLGFSQAIVAAVVLNESSQEQALASEAARQMIETCQSVPFEEVFARFNSDPLDDPAAGQSLSGSFPIEGLQAQADDLDGMVGSIEFPTMQSALGAMSLREDAVDEGLGTPMDLNGDGDIDALDHATDYMLLPVRVRVEWRGRGGNASLEFRTILSGL